jgi:hypothetical protein
MYSFVRIIYITHSLLPGENYPTSPFFVGTAANNGEGTMYIPFDDLAPTKSHNRISNTPGTCTDLLIILVNL